MSIHKFNFGCITNYLISISMIHKNVNDCGQILLLAIYFAVVAEDKNMKLFSDKGSKKMLFLIS